jgi:hypothetical protein
MIYLNLKTSTLRAPEYIGSEPTARATWLNLLCYSCEQENGGVIPGCAAWKDRQWQQTAGVTLAEVREESPLWQWSGDDLAVAFYPADKEQEVRQRREAGRRGGMARTQAKTQASRDNGAKHNPSKTQAQPKQEPNGKEGKDKISKGKEVGKTVAEVSATNDSDWLKELAENPAYRGINVEAELGKMTAWCAANGKQRTRRRFVNWLNRAERPIAITAQGHNGHNGQRKPASAWEIKQSIEAAQKEASRLEGDPQNKEPIDLETPWDRRLKPSVAVKVKELRVRAQELTGKLALLGKEAA